MPPARTTPVAAAATTTARLAWALGGAVARRRRRRARQAGVARDASRERIGVADRAGGGPFREGRAAALAIAVAATPIATSPDSSNRCDICDPLSFPQVR